MNAKQRRKLTRQYKDQVAAFIVVHRLDGRDVVKNISDCMPDIADASARARYYIAEGIRYTKWREPC